MNRNLLISKWLDSVVIRGKRVILVDILIRFVYVVWIDAIFLVIQIYMIFFGSIDWIWIYLRIVSLLTELLWGCFIGEVIAVVLC